MKTFRIILLAILSAIITFGFLIALTNTQIKRQKQSETPPEVKAAIEEMQNYQSEKDFEQEEKETGEEKENSNESVSEDRTEEIDPQIGEQVFLAVMEPTLKDLFDNNYKVEIDNKIITVSVWGDGITEELAAAKIGNQNCIDSWNGMIEEFKTSTKKIYDSLSSYGLQDYDVSINLINDTNTDLVLLSCFDGYVIYNDLTQGGAQ